VVGAYPDLPIQRYLEGSLPPYDEDLLFRALRRGGALADRFVELRELECGLSEYFGGRRLFAAAPALEVVDGRKRDDRARRFPAPEAAFPDGDRVGELLGAYWRWLGSTDIAAHRRAVVHCMGLIPEEAREDLRRRHRLGMSCGRIADSLSRSLGEVEESVRRIHAFLAGCVRMRLAHRQRLA